MNLLLFGSIGPHPPELPVAREIKMLPVGRFLRGRRPMTNNLHGVTAFRRYFPNGGMLGIVPVYEVDPLTIM